MLLAALIKIASHTLVDVYLTGLIVLCIVIRKK